MSAFDILTKKNFLIKKIASFFQKFDGLHTKGGKKWACLKNVENSLFQQMKMKKRNVQNYS